MKEEDESNSRSIRKKDRLEVTLGTTVVLVKHVGVDGVDGIGSPSTQTLFTLLKVFVGSLG